MADQTDPASTQAPSNAPKLEEIEGAGWTVQQGKVSKGGDQQQFQADGVESLTYNNPFGMDVERAWYDGKFVFAVDAGDLDIPEAGSVKVAKEYQPVYSVELDKKGKLKKKQEITGQYNIYDSVPGQKEYSAIWQFYYVVVPEGYRANTLRSAQDCEQSGYPIHKSNMFEN